MLKDKVDELDVLKDELNELNVVKGVFCFG